ncbi:uncharacterized protein LOC144110870 [Amblyomma americanum]
MTEMSQMSSIESSVAESRGAGGKGDDQSNRMFTFLVVLAILLLLAIVGIQMTAGSSHGSGEDDADGDGGGGESSKPPSGPGFIVKPPPPPTPPTTRRKRKTSTIKVTPEATTDKFSEPPTTLFPPKPQPGEQTDTLLCVVGQEAIVPKFPDDGVCDLTFYADLVYSNGDFTGKKHPVSWVVFQTIAQQSKKTGYGLSADMSSDGKFSQAFTGSGKGKQLLKQYYDKKIVHHGILNAEGSESTLTSAASDSSKLGLINTFRQLHTEWGAANNHLVVGVRFSSYKTSSQNGAKATALKTIVSKVSPTIVVVHTHVNSWKPGQKPVCMTSWEYPGSRDDQPNMKDVAVHVIPNASIPETTIVMPSFSLASQIFKTGSTYHSSKSSFSAKEFGFLNYVQVCMGVIKHKDYDAKADLYIWSQDNFFSFCAETTETIISKVKKSFLTYAAKKHGVAFFDVDLDDFDDSCKNGSFSRIKDVKTFLRT